MDNLSRKILKNGIQIFTFKNINWVWHKLLSLEFQLSISFKNWVKKQAGWKEDLLSEIAKCVFLGDLMWQLISYGAIYLFKVTQNNFYFIA